MRRNSASTTIPRIVWGILFALIWSGSFVATKFALGLSQPLWLGALRLGLATALLGPFYGLGVGRGAAVGGLAGNGRLAVAAILTQTVYLGATYTALHILPAAMVAIIVATLPVISLPIASLVLGERSTVRDIASTISAVLGVGLVVLGRAGGCCAVSGPSWGPILLTMVAVVALALGNVLLKPVVQGRPTMPLVVYQMAVGTVVLAMAAALIEGHPAITFRASSLAGMAYLVILGSIVGTWVWMKTLSKFSAGAASAFFLLTPIFGIVFSRVLLDEDITPLQGLGALVVCASIAARRMGTAHRTDAATT